MGSMVSPDEYRQLIGLFATGVTLVATEFEGELQVMTANAITSVSLDPLLMLVCVGKKLEMSETFGKTNGFSFNILQEDQEELSNYFADLWEEGEPPPQYNFVAWEGVPRLEGCIASIRCILYEVYDGGDHRIVVGQVVGLHKGAEPYHPLLFYSGRYEKLASS